MKRQFFIIQARMTSTRLPKKVMIPLFEEMGALEIFIKRLWKIKEDLIIATTDDESSFPIIKLCKRLGIKYFLGSTENVLERYYKCAIKYKVAPDDDIIRICSDSPCIDITIIEKVINFYHNHKFDYVTNDTKDGTPKGLNIEIFSFKQLKKAFYYSKTNFEKEHVTPYIKNNFNIGYYIHPFNHSYTLTLDTKEDLIYLTKLFKLIGKITFTYDELISGIKDIG